MFKIIISLMIFISTVGLYADQPVEFLPGSLVRQLKKADVNPDNLIALEMPDTVLKTFGVKGKFFGVDSAEDSNIKYIYVGRVNSCRAGGCDLSGVIPENANLDAEYFDYFILYNEEISVEMVKVFNYMASHGYEICTRGWLKQFIGHNASKELKVDGNIDAISGATISVYAITADVESKTDILRRYIDSELAQQP